MYEIRVEDLSIGGVQQIFQVFFRWGQMLRRVENHRIILKIMG